MLGRVKTGVEKALGGGGGLIIDLSNALCNIFSFNSWRGLSNVRSATCFGALACRRGSILNLLIFLTCCAFDSRKGQTNLETRRIGRNFASFEMLRTGS